MLKGWTSLSDVSLAELQAFNVTFCDRRHSFFFSQFFLLPHSINYHYLLWVPFQHLTLQGIDWSWQMCLSSVLSADLLVPFRLRIDNYWRIVLTGSRSYWRGDPLGEWSHYGLLYNLGGLLMLIPSMLLFQITKTKVRFGISHCHKSVICRLHHRGFLWTYSRSWSKLLGFPLSQISHYWTFSLLYTNFYTNLFWWSTEH